MNQDKSGTPTYLEMTESQQLAVRERILSRTIPEHRGRTDTPCWAWQGAKDYLCNFSSCCNPEHLALASAKVNNRRKSNVLCNREYCNSGRHKLSEKGVLSSGRSGETCRACHAENSLAGYHRRRAARTGNVVS